MLFPTTDFAIFFVLVFLGHWLLNPRPRLWKPFMIAASYVFYSWWDPRFVFLLAGVSLLAQLGALGVNRVKDPKTKRAALAVAVGAVIAPLLYFKYYGFFAVNVSNAIADIGIRHTLPLLQILLPVGVSFFTFMAISYVVDVYRGTVEPASWIDTFLYLSFFPHLVAGPIVRPAELIPQLDVRRDPRHVDIAGGGWLILGGLFKKVVVSSFLASAIVDPVFGDPAAHSAFEALLAIVGYAVVIYADFSGYTDIAIGIAKLLGFQFPENFNRPYSARSLQDFWRRWHMTLSRWLRDYVYIPLGGSKKGETRTYVNLMITMILGGLWHGAAWTFVFWGALMGAGLVAGAWKRNHARVVEDPAPLLLWLQRLGAFSYVCLGWVFFRSDSMSTAFQMLGRLFTGWGTPTTLVTPMVLFTIVGMLALQFVPSEPGVVLQNRISSMQPILMGAIFGLVLLFIASLGPQGVAPFIYFRF
jgi:alginate O-acetyltransferase complex protein AlgI